MAEPQQMNALAVPWDPPTGGPAGGLLFLQGWSVPFSDATTFSHGLAVTRIRYRKVWKQIKDNVIREHSGHGFLVFAQHLHVWREGDLCGL